jgi:hypothetical protein
MNHAHRQVRVTAAITAILSVLTALAWVTGAHGNGAAPLEPPTTSILRSAPGAARGYVFGAAGDRSGVHAVWTGATEVRSWRVVAGGRTVATARWNGLDTTITVPGHPAAVTVVALDKRGREIGRSASVTVS